MTKPRAAKQKKPAPAPQGTPWSPELARKVKEMKQLAAQKKREMAAEAKAAK